MTHQVNTKWVSNLHFKSNLDNKEIDFDATLISEKYDKGVSPKKIILSGLASCTGMDVVVLLNDKFKTPFEQFNIDITGELTKTQPKYYNKIHILYTIKVSKGDENKVEQAVELSLTKYCAVHAMLSQAAEITHSIKYL